MSYRKKLIEVSLPLDAINAASAREKSIRHGHPSTLHLWWARRPLAACRAVLFAQLVDDPSSCEDEFPTVEEQDRERDRLHGIIEAMVPWEASSNETILHAARYEIARSVARNGGPVLPPDWKGQAHAGKVIDYLQQHAPPVHDPFSGGGSIPLEAQRLGLRARGSDINPVAVLIGKALVESPQKFAGMGPVNPEADRHKTWKDAQGLADDVRYYGRWMRDEAEKRIGRFYPKVKLPSGAEATVIAWLWARTIPSPDPRVQGTHVPLVSSFIISAKKGKEAIVVPVVDRTTWSYRYEVKTNPSSEELENAKAGTKAARGANFVCLLTGAAIDDRHVKAMAKSGKMSAELMAVVAEGQKGRLYLAPDDQQRAAANVPEPEWKPDYPISRHPQYIGVAPYGFELFTSLFSDRQLLLLSTLCDATSDVAQLVQEQCRLQGRSEDYAQLVTTCVAFLITQTANHSSTICGWNSANAQMRSTFSRQALSMTWDYAECNFFSESSGSFESLSSRMNKSFDGIHPVGVGEVFQASAPNAIDRDATFSTDPPYYDNIPYADLSDFFYVFLRHALGDKYPELFRRVLVPKDEELVADVKRHGGRANAEKFFMDGMSDVFRQMAGRSCDNPISIYYAFRQSETGEEGMTSAGWASFLQAINDAGLVIDGTWPLRTEKPGRTRAIEANALASSIVLACRRREEGAERITRADFLRRLRAEMPDGLAKIRAAGVGPTDIQQAAIGPGIGIFTRHSAVLNPDGSEMTVRDALKLVNQVREELASEAQGDYDPPTRFAIDWFIVHGHKPARSGDAITMANAIGLGLGDLERAGIFKTGEGKAELMERGNLKADWSPGTDRYPTAWEACQHLIRRLESAEGGIDAAAALFAELGDLAEPAHQLAFRLYDICNNKGWAAEAQPYNNLIQEWPVIEERSRAFAAPPPAQGEMAI